jgi:hypothetical protein
MGANAYKYEITDKCRKTVNVKGHNVPFLTLYLQGAAQDPRKPATFQNILYNVRGSLDHF